MGYRHFVSHAHAYFPEVAISCWRYTHNSIDSTTPYAPSEAQRKGIQKHQAIFSLDYDTWEQLKDVFNIKECIIPQREETEETSRAWYG